MLAVALGLMLTLYGSARFYLLYEVHMAQGLLRDLGAVQIGSDEASLLPILREYQGYRRVSVIKDYEQDHEYLFEIGPGPESSNHTSKFGKVARAALGNLNHRFRRAIGLRSWNVVGRIGLQGTRVVVVSGTVVVEGKSEWLGGQWQLAETIPKYAVDRFIAEQGVSWPDVNHYLVGWMFLRFSKADGAGDSALSWITPSATREEIQAASKFSLQCLTSRSGCRTVCDLFPAALEYARTRTWSAGANPCSEPKNGY